MTRLTEDDVRGLMEGLARFDAGLRSLAGVDIRTVALHACGIDDASLLPGARVAVVPVSSGLGIIPRFSRCVAAVLEYLGCDARVVRQPDVKGLQEAVDGGAEVVMLADDDRFVALNVHRGVCADDDPCTAHGYVAALEIAADGLQRRPVLVLGQGPVGRAAAKRLLHLGAEVLVVEPDLERAQFARGAGARIVTLDEGLRSATLIVDATPAPDLIGELAISEGTIAAVPGVPSAFTLAAQARLGVRHIHEPLALGVAVMAVEALSGVVSSRV